MQLVLNEMKTSMVRKASYVTFIGLIIAFAGHLTLTQRFPVDPVVFVLCIVPIVVLIAARRHVQKVIPDLIFGAIDTGLLTIPAIIGGSFYEVTGWQSKHSLTYTGLLKPS
jgi:hypothetical protein